MSKKKRLNKRLDLLFQTLQENTPEAEALPIAPEAVEGWGWRCDAEGRYVACDESITTLLGYTPEALIGQPLDGFALDAASQEIVRHLLNEDDFPIEAEVTFLDSSGTPRAALLTIARRDAADGHLYGFVRLQHGGLGVLTPPPARLIPSTPLPGDLAFTPLPKGLRTDGQRIQPAEKPISPAASVALRQRTVAAVSGEDGAALAAPIPFQDKTALLEAIDPTPNREWSEDEQRLVEQVAEQLSLALENAQLFQTVQRRAAELEALHELTAAVTRSLDIKDIFGEALSQLRQLLHIDAGLVSRAEPDNHETLRLVAHWDLPQNLVTDFEQNGIAIATSPCGRTYTHEGMFTIADLTRPPEGVDTSALVEAGFRSYVGVPVIYQAQHLGTLCMFYRSPHKVTPHEEQLLYTIVAQIATAVANARLFQQTKEALETTDRLFRATAAFNTAATYEDILRTLHEHLGEHVHTVVLSVFEHPWDDDNPPEWVHPQSYWSTAEDVPQEVLQRLAEQHYRVSDFPTVHLIKHGRFISNTLKEEQWNEGTRRLYAEMLRAKAVAFVPVYIGGQWIGFLNVLYDRPMDFPQAERQFIQTIVSQAGVAFENLRALEAIQQHSQEIETLYQATADFNVAHSYEEVLESLAHALGSEVHAVAFGIFEFPYHYNSQGKVTPSWIQPRAYWSNLDISAETFSQLKAQKYPLSSEAAVFQAEEGVFISDLSEDQQWPEQIRALYLNVLQTRATVLLPLSFGDTWIGLINILYRSPQGFSQGDRQRIRALTAQAAIAIENLRSIENIQRRQEETEVLYQATAAFSAARSYDEIAAGLAQAVGEDVHTAALIMFDRPWLKGGEAPQWMMPVSHWTTLDVPQETIDILLSQRYHFEDYPIAYQLTEALFIPDADDPDAPWDENTRYIYHDLLEAKAAVFLPLYIGDRWIGFFILLYSQRQTFSEEEKQRIRALNAQAAVAAENLRSLETLQKRREETEALYRLAARLNTVRDYGEILDALRELSTLGVGAVNISFNVYNRPWVDLEDMPEWSIVAARWTKLPAEAVQPRYPLDRFPAARLLYTAEPLVLTDIANDPRIDEQLRELYTKQFRAVSTIFFPILVGGQRLGYVNAIYDQRREFSEEEIRMLQAAVSQAAIAYQNLQRYEDVQRRREEAQRLYQLASRLNVVSSHEDALEVLRALTPLGQGASNISINIFNRPWQDHDDVPEWVMVRARWSKLPTKAVLPRYPLRQFPEARHLRSDEPLIITDVATDPRLTEKGRMLYAQRFGATSTVFLPLVAGGQWIGYVNAIYPERREFSEEEIRFLETAVAQAAIVFQNLERFETAQRYARDLETAAITASEIAAVSQDMDTLLEKAVSLIRERFGFYHASVFLIDESGAYAEVKASTGEAGREMLERRHRLAVGSRSTVGQAAATREPVIINDTLNSEIHRPNPLLPETRAEAAIPLVTGGRLVGVLDIQSTEINAFTEEAVRMLRILATQLAVAIENARAYALEAEALEEMRRADELKTQFLANMSHELRTPLNSIIGFSRVILKGIDGPITELQQQDLTAIYNAGQHLLGLINDILDLSKIEAGKMELAFEEVNIADLVNSVMSTAVGLVKDKPVKLIKDIQEDLPIIHADPIRVRQILLNLISNAAKFTEQGHIKVTARLQTGPHQLPEILIAVEDTGTGIAPEDQHKLFKPFSQVDGSLTRKTGGTGLGLSITRNLVEMHGGRIWLESEVGKGTTFFFTLPIIQGASEEEEGERIILAIDDEPEVIHLYQRYLTPEGYRVIPLTDPTLAVARAKEMKPIAILLDIMMPGRDGWQVLQDLKKDPDTRHIPVIIASIVEDRDKGFSLGAAAYLTKPILQEDLMAALRNLDPDGKVKHILIVEDDQADRYLLTRLLEEGDTPYAVRTADDGEAALEAIQEQPPDAIILDLLLPTMDGFTLLERLRAEPQWRNIPVIIFTGADLSPAELARLRSASQELLRKGTLSTDELLQHLRQVLQQLEAASPPTEETA